MDCSIVDFLPQVFDLCVGFLEISQNTILQEYGAFGLFFNALLAATALPIPTEILVSTLLNGGTEEYVIIIALVTGGGLGGVLNYGIGFGGSSFFEKIKSKMTRKNKDKNDHEKSHKILKKFGWFAIFISAWIPIFGDLLLISAGAKKMEFRKYFIIMIAGKSLRAVVIVLGLGVIF